MLIMQLHRGFPGIQESDEKRSLRVKLVKKLYARYLVREIELSTELCGFINTGHCGLKKLEYGL